MIQNPNLDEKRKLKKKQNMLPVSSFNKFTAKMFNILTKKINKKIK